MCLRENTALLVRLSVTQQSVFGECAKLLEQQCILQREEATGTRGAWQHLLGRGKAASEHLHCTAGTGRPQRTLLEAAGDHRHPCCFYYRENKENLKTQEIHHCLCVSSSWSLRGGTGRDVLLCIASLGAQGLSTIVSDI